MKPERSTDDGSGWKTRIAELIAGTSFSCCLADSSCCASSWAHPESCRNPTACCGTLRAGLKSVLGPDQTSMRAVPSTRWRNRVSILGPAAADASQDAKSPPTTCWCQGGAEQFYRILEPEKTVYRIRDVDAAFATRWAGPSFRPRIGQDGTGRGAIEPAHLIADDQGHSVPRQCRRRLGDARGDAGRDPDVNPSTAERAKAMFAAV